MGSVNISCHHPSPRAGCQMLAEHAQSEQMYKKNAGLSPRPAPSILLPSQKKHSSRPNVPLLYNWDDTI